ncbi:uncharacterized protein LOC122500798 [Leptopilina heterotoma]|uniref:uncharacterized protein LOC122500798 n=1 Tax=Leptopilina heterotoma TaxID=63436 RepID=UPI001CA8BFD0|nr:uncharacterized protein LOC122500798 [Leptopilina heterotoma]
MKLLILSFTLCALWISTYGASVMAPNTGFQPTMIFQNECIAKVQNNTEIVENSVQLKYSFLTIFIKATQKIREQGSLKNLDSILEQTCLPATDENLLYDVLMSIIKSCVEQEFSFTPEETVMIKEKLEKIFCNLYLKLALLLSFSPECVTEPGIVNELQKCSQGQTINLSTPVRDWFFGNSEICTTQLKAIECLNDVFKDNCSADISKQIHSIMTEARNIIGCNPEPNSISVIDAS